MSWYVIEWAIEVGGAQVDKEGCAIEGCMILRLSFSSYSYPTSLPNPTLASWLL